MANGKAAVQKMMRGETVTESEYAAAERTIRSAMMNAVVVPDRQRFDFRTLYFGDSGSGADDDRIHRIITGSEPLMTAMDYSRHLRKPPFGRAVRQGEPDWARIQGYLAIKNENNYVRPGHLFGVRMAPDGNWEVYTVWRKCKPGQEDIPVSLRGIEGQDQRGRLFVAQTGLTYDDVVTAAREAYGDDFWTPSPVEFWNVFGLDYDNETGRLGNILDLV